MRNRGPMFESVKVFAGHLKYDLHMGRVLVRYLHMTEMVRPDVTLRTLKSYYFLTYLLTLISVCR